MRLRRFTAATATEALRKVKEALGDGAVILATRQGVRGEVEITAAIDAEPAAPPRGPAPAAAPSIGPRPAAPSASSASPAGPPRESCGIAVTAPTCGTAAGDDRTEIALVHRQLRRLCGRVSAIDCLLRRDVEDPETLGARGRELAAALEQSGLARRLASRIALGVERAVELGADDRAALALARHLPLAGGRPAARISVFVGPSGVGKTTTIAKLAASPALAGRGGRPGLILADSHRVGAAEHLGAFARLLDVPLRTVHDAAGMRDALAHLAACDPILVDTAGFASDGERRREVAAILEGTGEAVEVTAVLSATTSPRALARAWDALEPLAPSSCVVTKMDECDEPGEACTWLSEAGVPLRWLGTGPDVPGGLVAASGDAIGRWLVAA
jgi:flagellar biosynthesis protein FlhF